MTQNTPSSQWKSLTNCLGRRVLSVSLILLVIPLFFHAFLLYRQAIYQTSIDNLTNLSLLARSESAYVKELVQKNTLDIKTIELLGSYDKAEDLKNLSAELAQVALSEELSTLFIAEKNTSGSWNIIAAAHPERVNMTDVGLGEFNTISVL